VAVDQAATRPEWRLIRSPLEDTFATAILLPFFGGGQSMAVSLETPLLGVPRLKLIFSQIHFFYFVLILLFFPNLLFFSAPAFLILLKYNFKSKFSTQ
jgi:hypothetical protein